MYYMMMCAKLHWHDSKNFQGVWNTGTGSFEIYRTPDDTLGRLFKFVLTN